MMHDKMHYKLHMLITKVLAFTFVTSFQNIKNQASLCFNKDPVIGSKELNLLQNSYIAVALFIPKIRGKL